MHTPGPWTLKQHGPNHFTLTGQAPGLIADIHSDQDAALVRAAPELLIHLQRLVAAIDRAPANFADGLADEARAAIAKATEV